MADEFDASGAQSEFEGYLDKVRRIIQGLESDLIFFRNHRIESRNEQVNFGQDLRNRLDNSRRELDVLARSVESSFR